MSWGGEVGFENAQHPGIFCSLRAALDQCGEGERIGRILNPLKGHGGGR